MTKRVVTDILTVEGAPVAFDEIKQGTYRGVCPYCAENLDVVEAITFGVLFNKLWDITVAHIQTCIRREASSTDLWVTAPKRRTK